MYRAHNDETERINENSYRQSPEQATDNKKMNIIKMYSIIVKNGCVNQTITTIKQQQHSNHHQRDATVYETVKRRLCVGSFMYFWEFRVNISACQQQSAAA